MSQVTLKIGPADHGRPMTLDDFREAERQEGRLYELGRGVIVVSDVPGLRHASQFTAIRNQLVMYQVAHPDQIDSIFGGGECRLLIEPFGSERHPDLSVYKNPPVQTDDLWSTWIPDLVIEIVSPGSEQRDYTEKPEEYLTFGVREYWIVDAEKEEVLVLRRVGGKWRDEIVKPPQIYKPALLPAFEFNCEAAFAAARSVTA